jgi:hypothetical protein
LFPSKRVRAGKLVDVVAGTVLKDQTIVITGERITSVGPERLGQGAGGRTGNRPVGPDGAARPDRRIPT